MLRPSDLWDGPGRATLYRLFSAFPGGFPGVGLLILRIAVGLIAAAQGIAFLSAGATAPWSASVVGALLLICGGAVLVGVLSPLASPIVGLGSVGVFLSWWPLPAWSLFDSKIALLEFVAMSLTITLLGPGAYSLDARLFGWREIVIPPAPPKEN